MKFYQGLSLLLLSTALFGAEDPSKPLSFYKENFQATVFAANGALHCEDAFTSSFGHRPGVLVLGSWNGNKQQIVSAYDGRLAQILYFSKELPDTTKCKDIVAKLPKGTFSAAVEREIRGAVTTGVTSEDLAQLYITEIGRITIAPDIILEGSYVWRDFRVPTEQIDLTRETMLLFLDHMTWSEKAETTIHVDRLSCQSVSVNQGDPQGRLVVNVVPQAVGNARAFTRLFETLEECQDTLSDLDAQISNSANGTKFPGVQVSRKLTIEQNRETARRYRVERIGLDLLGVKFVSVNSLPLW
ncbi:hypothetical protein K2X33_15000 [bacterium]|nr:hypothetical protein [bacterium]